MYSTSFFANWQFRVDAVIMYYVVRISMESIFNSRNSIRGCKIKEWNFLCDEIMGASLCIVLLFVFAFNNIKKNRTISLESAKLY